MSRLPGNARVDDYWHNKDGSHSTRYGVGNRWRVRWTDLDGKQRTKTFRRRIDAKQFADRITSEIERGDYVDRTDATTIKELRDQWSTRRSHVKAKTKNNELCTWAKHIEPVWGSRRANTIKKFEITGWIADMHESGAGYDVIRQSRNQLRQILNYATEVSIIAANPAADLKLPPKPIVAKKYLTIKQVEALATACRYGGNIVRFLAYTGLRWGEMAALTVGDIDTAKRRISVSKSVTDVGGVMTPGTPKSGKARSVPYVACLDEVLLPIVTDAAPSTLLFPSHTDTYMRSGSFTKSSYSQAVNDCMKSDSTFPKVTIHDLRHTAASIAISSGANVKAVQRMLGHATASLTLDTYADLFDSDLDEVATRMNEKITSSH